MEANLLFVKKKKSLALVAGTMLAESSLRILKQIVVRRLAKKGSFLLINSIRSKRKLANTPLKRSLRLEMKKVFLSLPRLSLGLKKYVIVLSPRVRQAKL